MHACASVWVCSRSSFHHCTRCRCTSGCTCEPKLEVDALHSLRQSTIFLVRLLVSQSERCEVTVTLLENTRSGKHKFKVSGIMMNEYIGNDITEKLHEEQWLTQLQATAHGGAERAAGSSSTVIAADDAAGAAQAKESLGAQGTAVAASLSGGDNASDRRRRRRLAAAWSSLAGVLRGRR